MKEAIKQKNNNFNCKQAMCKTLTIPKLNKIFQIILPIYKIVTAKIEQVAYFN